MARILKLHGSTNWLIPHQSINLNTGTMESMCSKLIGKLLVFHGATAPYKTYRDRYWGPYSPFSYCYYPPDLPSIRDDSASGSNSIRVLHAIDLPDHGLLEHNNTDVQSMPLIIPPELHKQYSLHGRIFDTLWTKALDAISRCSELLILGYSFPRTDTESRRLILRAISQNTNIRRITVLNPQPDPIVTFLKDDICVPDDLLRVLKIPFEPVDGSFDFLLRSD